MPKRKEKLIMNVKLIEFLSELAAFQPLFAIMSLLFLLVALAILCSVAAKKLKDLAANTKKKKSLEKQNIKNIAFEKVKDKKKAEILRAMACPDAIDPAPNSYLKIDDMGKELYVRTFTIAKLPRQVDFAVTFAGLFDYPGCTSSVYIIPENEQITSRKMDRQINIVGGEYGAAAGDPNRSRKLRNQYQELNTWAEQLESGEMKFFKAGFLFTFACESLQELNKLSDGFRNKALIKSVIISNAYAVQAEAFEMNAPFNNLIKVGSSFIKTSPIKYFDMDKYSLSTVFNYTQTRFSHKDGIVLGRDMESGDPIFYDLFDPTHDGFTAIIAGKTGSGKSAMMKMYVCRSTLYDYRYVCIDSQARKGVNEGEFAGPAQCVNGVNFKISTDSDCILNPFEIGETRKTVKEGMSNIREVATVELNDKISMVVHTLSTMVQRTKEFTTIESFLPVERIITDTVSALYQDFGIREGDVDSLYTTGTVVKNGQLVSGRVKKALPTMTDFYKKLLIHAHNNTDDSLNKHYSLVLMGTKDFVRELYYSAETLRFISREELKTLRFREGKNKHLRIYHNPDTGRDEDVVVVKGIRAYYDGQSTVSISPECPFTNIDISGLPEHDKVLARQIAMDIVNEMFIKKNSEDIKAARKLVFICDECHENFGLGPARKALDNIVRTARKRNVGLFLASQTLAEYQRYEETKAILKQATTKFVFKQDFQDREYLKDVLGITDAQTGFIVERLGGSGKDEENAKRHRGEVCIVDNKNVAFCKVDYLKRTEKLPVDTDAREIEKAMFQSA